MDSLLESFKCSFCSKRFSTENGSDSHQRAVHSVKYSQLKPFACPACPKRFATENDLKHHVENAGKRHKKMTGDIYCLYPFCKRKFQSQYKFTRLAVKQHWENPGNWHKIKGLLDRALTSVEVNIFIRDYLQPDKEFHNLYNNAIDSLYKELQRLLRDTFYGIHNLIEGGSIAKGTALKKHSDLDCVMVMKSIKDADQLSGKLPVILTDLESRLKMKWKGDPWKLKSIKKSTYLVQFKMSRYSEEVKVDLLPRFEANVESTDAEKAEFYRQMMHDKENWEYYSAALVKLQVKFVDKRPSNVKDLIRLVKYWRKTYIPQIDHERLPPSYLLELLTIHAWEKAKCPKKFNIKIGFKAVMELLENHSNLRVSWDDNYSKSIFIKYSDILHFSLKDPHVIDPANPTNNLYDAVDCWDKVEKVAKETMQTPLLSDVVRVTDNWS
ncbi:unnamed protein product [Porites lobata]|uniref:C2H2-type domain-containing protein n=1 Tax=Porites lobata TaxID=104759 RepID=A0ABN8NKW3_9CNID|nr:unnamed protein product [Porites lobata]